jgi:hypothetical protein
MFWVIVAAVYVGAIIWSWRQQLRIADSQDLYLNFGDEVDSVEPLLRLLASHAEWQGLCLNVYINASEEEARAIALRLGPQVPLNLILEEEQLKIDAGGDCGQWTNSREQ